jgi:hypothetical protein
LATVAAVITNVYIDGFNLYYGCLRTSSYKWLDLGRLCAGLLPDNQVHRIRYFTARIQGRPDDPDGPNRQEAYLAALGSVPGLSIHYGHFLASTTKAMPVDPPPPPASPLVKVHKMEEKGSDVNLATWMVTDAFENDCELAVLITNDSDLAEPMNVVASRCGKQVGLINPHPRRASRAPIRQKPIFVKEIRKGLLAASQFPDQVRVGKRTLHKPPAW